MPLPYVSLTVVAGYVVRSAACALLRVPVAVHAQLLTELPHCWCRFYPTFTLPVITHYVAVVPVPVWLPAPVTLHPFAFTRVLVGCYRSRTGAVPGLLGWRFFQFKLLDITFITVTVYTLTGFAAFTGWFTHTRLPARLHLRAAARTRLRFTLASSHTLLTPLPRYFTTFVRFLPVTLDIRFCRLLYTPRLCLPFVTRALVTHTCCLCHCPATTHHPVPHTGR